MSRGVLGGVVDLACAVPGLWRALRVVGGDGSLLEVEHLDGERGERADERSRWTAVWDGPREAGWEKE